MDSRHSAAIIPFPCRPAPPGAAQPVSQPTGAVDPQERLRAALAGLEAAVRAQREAVAAWRGALGNLHGSVAGLGTSLRSYNAELDALGAHVAGVNRQARALEAWADGAIGGEAAPDAAIDQSCMNPLSSAEVKPASM